MTPNIVAVVSILLPVCCHIGSGKPNLRIFVEDIVALLGAITDKLMKKLVCSRNWKLSNDQIKFATKIIKAKLIACDFLVKRVVIFGVVLYRNQCPVNCILRFAELHIGSSIRYK